MTCVHCYRSYTTSLLSRSETPFFLHFTTSSIKAPNATTIQPRYFSTASQHQASLNKLSPQAINHEYQKAKSWSEQDSEAAKNYIMKRNLKTAKFRAEHQTELGKLEHEEKVRKYEESVEVPIQRARHAFVPPAETYVNAHGKPITRGGPKVFEERGGRSAELAESGSSTVDPYILAEDTKRLLQTHGVEAALKLVRKQGSTVNTVVSWNTIILNRMKNNSQAQAMKLYNEVKATEDS